MIVIQRRRVLLTVGGAWFVFTGPDRLMRATQMLARLSSL